eukprot:gene430-3768_t
MAVNIGTDAAKAVLKDETRERDRIEDELDDDDVPTHIREARLAQLKKEMEQLRLAKEHGNGQLTEIENEKALFDITTTQPRVVCHFFHPDFRRCAIMNSHLQDIARRHFTTKFVTLNAEKAPFLVQKFQVQELPTLVVFIDAKVKDRIVGFEDVGLSDNFPTHVLEKRIAVSKVISTKGSSFSSKQTNGTSTLLGIRQARRASSDSDDSDSD